MLQMELSPAQAEIVREICDLQIMALTNLSQKPMDAELEEILQEIEHPRTPYYEWINKGILLFNRVRLSPDLFLKELTGDYMRAFRHILATQGDNIFADRPNAVRNLWRKILIIDGPIDVTQN